MGKLRCLLSNVEKDKFELIFKNLLLFCGNLIPQSQKLRTLLETVPELTAMLAEYSCVLTLLLPFEWHRDMGSNIGEK